MPDPPHNYNRRATDHTPVRSRLLGLLLVAALIMASFSSIMTAVLLVQTGNIQDRMKRDQAALEVRRYKAELRACTISQSTVKNERRIIQRSMNTQRRQGTLTREGLRFFRVTLKELKIPSCTPTDLGFPKFEPTNLGNPVG